MKNYISEICQCCGKDMNDNIYVSLDSDLYYCKECVEVWDINAREVDIV